MQDEENIKNQDTEEGIQKIKETENLEDTENDEILEFEFNDDGEEDLKKTLKKLRADLKLAKKEKEEYLTGWQKERADFANYKKEENERIEYRKEMIREQILESFLALADSFSMAFANKQAWEKVDSAWRIGVEYIYNQMNSIFEEYGVKSFGSLGDIFDPNLHESVELVATDVFEKDHKIESIIQTGYKMKDKILRPAKVKIYEYKNGN